MTERPESRCVPAPALESIYRAHIDEIRAVPTESLIPINLELGAAVARVLSVLDTVQPWQQELQQRLPHFDPRIIHRLRGYAYALLHAHTRCEGRRNLDRATRDLLAKASELRSRFLSDANAMARRKLIDRQVLEAFTGVRCHTHKVSDLSALVQLFRQNWEGIRYKTAVTLEELEEAYQLTLQLDSALDRFKPGSDAMTSRRLIRAQAFTLFARTYDELRAAVAYVKWTNAEYETIAPSLYAGRRKHPCTPRAHDLRRSTSHPHFVASHPEGFRADSD
jgi:hypothetical protein